MKSYSSVEAAARDYRRMRELEDPRAVHRVEVGEVCAYCESGRKTEIGGGPRRTPGRRTAISVVCSSCRRPWSGVRRSEVVRGSGGLVNGDARLEAHAELSGLREIFEPRPRDLGATSWALYRFVLFALLDERVGKIERVVELARGTLTDREGRRISPPEIPGAAALDLEGAKYAHRCAVETIAKRLERAGRWTGRREGGKGGSSRG